MGRLLLKNIFRNKRRTLLTVSGVAVSLFLISSLAIVYTALGNPFEGSDNNPRMMVRRRTGLGFSLPASYGARIHAVPGVAAVSSMTWFGGYWKDPANTFANFAMDADTVFDVLDRAGIPADQLEVFKRERTAAVAGRQVAEKFHWKIGDRITLLGDPSGFTPELTLRGIFSGFPDDQFYFHYDYWNESRGKPNRVGLYWIRLERPEMASRAAETIDQMFRNTDAETKTESESAFLLGFISMLGNVRGMILVIGSAVIFAILLIVANTMAMSVRERLSEAAVMRSLGFRETHVLGLFVGESLVLTLLGALVGVGGAKLIYDTLALSKIGIMVWVDLRMRMGTIVFCFAIALGISLLAAFLPAYRAARVNIAQALRFVG